MYSKASKLKDFSKYTPPEPSPAQIDLQRRVREFLATNDHKLKKAHYDSRNPVHYHSCCNSFSSKKFFPDSGHKNAITLCQFLGNTEGEHVTKEMIVRACCKASEAMPGVKYMSTPTFNREHEDLDYLNKRLDQEAEEAAEVRFEMAQKIAELEKEVKKLEADKERLKRELEQQKAFEQEEYSINTRLTYFLRYNKIDPDKVIDGWCPPEGQTHTREGWYVKWPNFNVKSVEELKALEAKNPSDTYPKQP